eukprot:g1685.t1
MNKLTIDVDPEANMIRIWNNGEGVPIDIHADEKVYIPELIFGHLLTGSNFDDDEKKLTGGRNGYGAKLANIFSTKFIIETGDGKQQYFQVFEENMTKIHSPEINKSKVKGSFTCVSFHPDLAKFGMTHLDNDIVCLMRKRAYDMAGVMGKTVKVFFNGVEIPLRGFEDYVALFMGPEEYGLTRIHHKANERWELIIGLSEGEFRQMSFVNSICTSKGGTHVNYIMDQVCKGVIDRFQKKVKDLVLRNMHVKNHIQLFLNCMIENPSFDSQTKENLTTKVGSFGSHCEIPTRLIDELGKEGLLNQLMELAKVKTNQLLKKSDGAKKSSISVPKLEDAILAGTKDSSKCTLILTEGDSAKALAVAGLSVVGRDTFGVFPLKGKVLNVREASSNVISSNKEIQNLKKIMGFKHGKEYDNTKDLRYGHIMIMADQDLDGSHIKGLIINLVHYFYPSLIKCECFLQYFVTPIVKAKKGNESRSFYSLPEYKAWRETTESQNQKWEIKYYKGLGTSTAKEAREYFRNLGLHRKSQRDDDAIELAFSKKRADDRKNWIAAYEEGTCLDTLDITVPFCDFVNKELVQYAQADLLRSIPSLVDGLKVSQRKILFACLKKKLHRDMKVSDLVGYVSSISAYHHGEQSLANTIIGMAHNFVGSNNINLLVPSGQFGTRLEGGNDAASPRYIYTRLSNICRLIYKDVDNPLLEYLEDDGVSIQPKWYVPVIPMILINGAEGIGTGWSSYVPSFNPDDVINNCLRMLDGLEPIEMKPWYLGYKGSIKSVDLRNGGPSYVFAGNCEELETGDLEIRELGLKKWTSDYRKLLDDFVEPKKPGAMQLIESYSDYSTEASVRILVHPTAEQLENLKEAGFDKSLQLTSRVATTNMVLFNGDGVIVKYDSTNQIMMEFFEIRRLYYVERRKSLIQVAKYGAKKASNQERFVSMMVDEKLKLGKKSYQQVVDMLDSLGFDRLVPESKKSHETEMDETGEEVTQNEASFHYLLDMKFRTMTKEKANELKMEAEKKEQLVTELENTSPDDMWRADLLELKEAWDKFRDEWMAERDDAEKEAEETREREASRRGYGTAARGRGRGRTITANGANVVNAGTSIRGGTSARGIGRGRGRGRTAAVNADVAETSSRGGTSARGTGRGRGRGRGRIQSSQSSLEASSAISTEATNDDVDELSAVSAGEKRDRDQGLEELSVEKGPRKVRRGDSRKVVLPSSEDDDDDDDENEDKDSDYNTDASPGDSDAD